MISEINFALLMAFPMQGIHFLLGLVYTIHFGPFHFSLQPPTTLEERRAGLLLR